MTDWGKILDAAPFATYTTGASTWDAPTVESLLAWGRDFRERQAAIDDGLRRSIREAITRNNWTTARFADFVGVDVATLVAVLAGSEPVPRWFWDRIRATFEPMRERGPGGAPGG